MNQIGLHDILERAAIFADRSRERLDSDRAAVELFEQRHHQHPIESIESRLVHIETLERVPST